MQISRLVLLHGLAYAYRYGGRALLHPFRFTASLQTKIDFIEILTQFCNWFFFYLSVKVIEDIFPLDLYFRKKKLQINNCYKEKYFSLTFCILRILKFKIPEWNDEGEPSIL